MLAIISNLKFCYKFFQEENFAELSDSDFARFENTLESTEKQLAMSKKLMLWQLMNSACSNTREKARRTLECLDRLSHLTGQFWEQELESDFTHELEVAWLSARP